MGSRIQKAVRAVIIGLLCLSAVIGTTGGYAYFSGQSDRRENKLSLVKGEMEQKGAVTILEPEWDARKGADESYGLDLQPGQEVVKDPKVRSEVDYPCWVFVELSMPTGPATIRREDSPYSHVTFEGDAEEYEGELELLVPDVDPDGWELYMRYRGKHTMEYVYGYKVPLVPHGMTNPLFGTVTVPEFTRYIGEGYTYINVTARTVQTEGCSTLDDAAEKLGYERDIEQDILYP